MAIIDKNKIVQKGIFDDYIREVKAAKEQTEALSKALQETMKVSKSKLEIADQKTLKSITDTLNEIKKVNQAVKEKQTNDKNAIAISKELARLEALNQKAEAERLKSLQQLKKVAAEQVKVDREGIKNEQEKTKAKRESIKNEQERFKSLQQLKKISAEQNKADREAIKNEQERFKSLQQLKKVTQEQNKANQIAIKNKQEEKKVEQQALKNKLEEEKINQQRLKTKITEAREQERLNKIKQREAAIIEKSNSAYNKLSVKLNEARKKYKDLAAAEKENTKEGKALLKNITQLDGKLKRIDASVGQFQRSVGNYGKAVEKVNGRLKRFGATVVAAFSVRAIKNFAQESVNLFRVQAKAEEQVKQGIQTTNAAAGRSFEELSKQASELQQNSLFGDETILKDVTANLLTFTNVAGEQFDKTQQAVLDFAARTNTDLKSATIQFGKALNDPIKGLTALSRSGVQFTDQQKELIKSLVEGGDVAAAQELILAELNTQFGGSAEASARADGGITQLSNSFGDFQEKAGKVILEGLQPLIKTLREFFDNLTQEDVNKFLATLGKIAKVLGLVAAAFVVVRVSTFAYNKAVLLVDKTTKILAATQTAFSTVMKVLSGQIKIATLFQKAFNKVLKANPVGLVIAGITALIGVFKLLKRSYEDVTNATKDFAKAQKESREESEKFATESQQRTSKNLKLLELEGVKGKELAEAKKALIEQERIDNEVAQSEIRESLEETQKRREKLQKEQEKILADVRKQGGAIFDPLAQSFKFFGDAINGTDTAAANLKDKFNANKEALDILNKEINESNSALGRLKKSYSDVGIASEEAAQDITKAQKEQIIRGLQDQVAAIKLQILNSEQGSREELKLKKKLEDAKLKLTLATNDQITKNQRDLLRKQTDIAKEELEKLFKETNFDAQIQVINDNSERILMINQIQLANGLQSQEEFNEKSIQLEIERLEKLIKLREASGKDVSELNTKLAQERDKLNETVTANREKEIEDAKNRELEIDKEFYTKREIALKEQAQKDKEIRGQIDEILLEEKIQSLEDERLVLEEAQKKRQAQGLELSKEDANRQLEIYKELAELRLDQQISNDEKLLDARQKFVDRQTEIAEALADIEQNRIDKLKKQIDEEISQRRRRISELQALSQNENSNAAESVAFEERRIAELERKKEEQAAKQKLIELTLSSFQTYQSEIQSGKNPAQALASTFKNITLLSQFAKGLQSFEVGTERTSPNENIDGKGGFRAILHPDERVVTKEQNKPLLDAGISNEELPKLALLGKQNLMSGLVVTNKGNLESIELVNEVKGLRKDLNRIERVKDVGFDKKTKVISEVIQSVNSKEVRKSKW